MLQKDVFNKFKELFPQHAEQIEMWFPNGKNSVRVRDYNKHDYVFTYHGRNSWSFETVDCHVERMRGGSKM